MSSSPEMQPPPGVVELREDIPLKPSGSYLEGPRLCGGGPRLILGAFAVLTAAITIALLTQIYYGDYEVVPHGSVSSSAAACSRAGTALMRGGARALDAAAAAALCLAVLAPHRTSLDASGSLVHWEYRQSRNQLPTVAEWGAGAEAGAGARAGAGAGAGAPRLVAALAALHAQLGVLPWAQVLQPAIDIAREGFTVSSNLAASAAARGVPGYPASASRTEPALADYLQSLQNYTSAELCAAWSCTGAVRVSTGEGAEAGAWRVWAAGAGGAVATAALQNALAGDPHQLTPASAYQSAVESLKAQAQADGAQWPGGVASGLAVVDPRDTYVALVTGLSVPFGSEGDSVAGGAWRRDEPTGPLDLAPAIITDEHICGTRYVMGGESGVALAQAAAAALAGGEGGAGAGAAAAVEEARVAVRAGGELAAEGANGTALPALNFVQQTGDALLSHADSRGEGLASRF